MLDPISPKNSSAREAYVRLREAILAGTMPPGSRLNERRLAEQLGVSRTPVREALKMLEAEDFVVSLASGRAQVRRVTAEEVEQSYSVRSLLEGYAARLAAERIAPRDVASLRALNERMRNVLERAGMDTGEQVKRLAELNAEFHRRVLDASGNQILARTVQSLMATPLYATAYFWFTPDRRLASLDDHDQMIDLLERRDGEEAGRLWQEHLQHGRDHILEGLARVGFPRDDEEASRL